ncbi:UNVERIFIED_CONTAM: hypothetical protein K2H54_004566 [Gekko kuhli]
MESRPGPAPGLGGPNGTGSGGVWGSASFTGLEIGRRPPELNTARKGGGDPVLRGRQREQAMGTNASPGGGGDFLQKGPPPTKPLQKLFSVSKLVCHIGGGGLLSKRPRPRVPLPTGVSPPPNPVFISEAPFRLVWTKPLGILQGKPHPRGIWVTPANAGGGAAAGGVSCRQHQGEGFLFCFETEKSWL